nr:unnamed protein product [Haemonchus contortus]
MVPLHLQYANTTLEETSSVNLFIRWEIRAQLMKTANALVALVAKMKDFVLLLNDCAINLRLKKNMVI